MYNDNFKLILKNVLLNVDTNVTMWVWRIKVLVLVHYFAVCRWLLKSLNWVEIPVWSSTFLVHHQTGYTVSHREIFLLTYGRDVVHSSWLSSHCVAAVGTLVWRCHYFETLWKLKYITEFRVCLELPGVSASLSDRILFHGPF